MVAVLERRSVPLGGFFPPSRELTEGLVANRITVVQSIFSGVFRDIRLQRQVTDNQPAT
jgi:hypothetical protein